MKVLGFILIAVLFEITYGEIHSSGMLGLRGPELIDLNSAKGYAIKEKLTMLRMSLQSRKKRDAPEIRRPKVNRFDLVNDTSHNQALIHWSGENSTVVFILTRKKSGSSSNKVTESTLWRSDNYGETYKLMTDKFDNKAILKSYFVCPTDKQKVLFVDAMNNSRRIWVSTDEGKTYTPHNVSFSVEKIDFHPEQSNWLLAYDKFMRELYCSMDLGSTWKKLGSEVTAERYYWYVKDKDTGPKANQIVHFEYRDIATVVKRIFKVKSCYIPDCTPSPFQGNLDALQNVDMDSLVVQDAYVFVQKSGAANKLYISYNRGPFKKALFPLYRGRAQSHFHVISSDGECVVVGVNHDNGLTHLFFSDLEGYKFRQSLSNVRYYNRKTNGKKVYTVDMHEVQGLIGTYVANIHNSDGYGSGYNTTVITWDNGQSWSNITKNVKDETGKDITGCRGCQLNLHLSMDQTRSGYYMPAILSKKSVPGLIIAHGTYSLTVEDSPKLVGLFVSNDNGKSWTIARKQRHLVVIANHGAVIVAIKMIFLSAVRSLDFSSDYGKTWHSYDFAQQGQQVNVDGILTEPGERTHYLTLFGHKTYSDSWRVFQIDMSPVLSKACDYPADFENITLPTQLGDNKCHLGLVQLSERLKQGLDCLIPPLYKRISTKTICNCTMKDYECDLGYKDSLDESGKYICVKQRLGMVDEIGGSIFQDIPLEREGKCVGNLKNVSSGFRKIPGDKCQNEVANIGWKNVQCDAYPTTIPTTTSKPPPDVKIQLVNKTEKAKIGENLIFSIQGVADDSVVWNIFSPKPTDKSKEIEKNGDNKNLTLVTEEPGKYEVSLQSNNRVSNMIVVEFWYPIEKVHLYHPPVVAAKKKYNASAWTQTSYGLRGNQSLLGDVIYIWNVQDRKQHNIHSRTNHISKVAPSKTGTHALQITVRAENSVSFQTTSGRIYVKEFVETLVLNMECFPKMDPKDMNDVWLQEFGDSFRQELFETQSFIEVIKNHRLNNEINLFVYVPPSQRLQIIIYLAPSTDDTKEQLFKAAAEIQRAIASEDIILLVSNHRIISVKDQYIIDHDGKLTSFAPVISEPTGTNGAVIAVVVIFVILIVVVAFFVVRYFSKKTRFDRYLRFTNLRPGGRQSRIVRQDRAHIVDEEFIDDDLDTMEGIGSQDATLQFQG